MRLLVEAGNERAGAAAGGTITHDTYQKALDRLCAACGLRKA
jgi:hypothetical protein